MANVNEKPMSTESPMYVYATEMIGTYYSLLNLKDKSVLTICGAGDHVIDAFHLGAKEVIGFDLNKFSKNMLNIKIAAIKSLNYTEFLTFFGDEKVNNGLAYNLYQKLSNYLPKETKDFFDNLYEEFQFDGQKLAASEHFRQRDDLSTNRVSIKEIISYLKTEEDYLSTRKILESKNIKFIHSDLRDISSAKELSGKKFDFINISNTHHYVEKEDALRFYDNVLIPLKKILAPKGKIFFMSYSDKMYPNRFSKTVLLMNTQESLNKMKSRSDFSVSVKEFPGILTGHFDRIVIFENN